MDSALLGLLTIVTLALALVFGAFAAVHVKRLGDRTPAPISEENWSAKAVLNKVRKREPMSRDELDYAKQIVADRSSPMALCIPGALFMLGCFYVFGSLYRLLAWSHALRADIPRADPHVDLHKPRHSASPQRKVERATTENGLKQHKACGVAVSLISGELDVGSYVLPTASAGDNVSHRLLAFRPRLVVS